jgi:hypothetical protein
MAQEAVLGGSVDLLALGALLVRFLSEMPEALISSALAPGGASCPAALRRRGGGGGGGVEVEVEVEVEAYLDSMPSVHREMLCMLIEFLQRVAPMCELPMAIFAQALTHHRRDDGPAALALTTHLLQSQVIAAGGGGGGGGGGGAAAAAAPLAGPSSLSHQHAREASAAALPPTLAAHFGGGLRELAQARPAQRRLRRLRRAAQAAQAAQRLHYSVGVAGALAEQRAARIAALAQKAAHQAETAQAHTELTAVLQEARAQIDGMAGTDHSDD